MNGNQVVEAARLWLGTPYRHRASTLGAGCDCLGLLRGVWRTLYGDEPVAVPAYRANLRGDDHPEALREAAERFLAAETGPVEAGQVVLFRLRTFSQPALANQRSSAAGSSFSTR